MTVDKDKFIAKLHELYDHGTEGDIMTLLETVFHPDRCVWSDHLKDIVCDLHDDVEHIEIIDNSPNEIAALKRQIQQLSSENSKLRGAYNEALDRMQQAENMIRSHT